MNNRFASEPGVTIRAVPEEHPDSWDEFIRRFESAGPFHSSAWTECFKSERLTPIYLRFVSEGQVVGGIAGLVVDPAISIMRGIDRKIFFFSGPALCQMNYALIRDCMLALDRYARDHGFTSLITSPRDFPYRYDWGEAKVHTQSIEEHIVDLRDSWETVKRRMRKSIPEQARKAQRSGLTFHECRDASLLPELLRLIENTRLRNKKRKGASFSPFYIAHLSQKSLDCLVQSGLARFFVARKDSEVLCVLLVFAFSRRAYALLIGCNDEGYLLRAPAFAWFNAMKLLQGGGTEFLNLAGGNSFAKMSLGAERRPCMGSVSPYLKGPARNLLFQTYRWLDGLITSIVQDRNSGAM